MTTEDRSSPRRTSVLPGMRPDPDAPLAVLGAWARVWGPDPLRVQGPGGNLSVKRDANLWIKASGSRLDRASSDHGWTEVDWRSCRDALPPPRPGIPGRAAEAAYAELVLRAPRTPAMPRPSMELGMHAVLRARHVAHLHSLSGILTAAMRHGDPRLAVLLHPVRSAGFAVRRVPAARPGLELTWAIARRLEPPTDDTDTLYLLANHGVVWVSNDATRIRQAESDFEARARDVLGLASFGPPEVTEGPNGLECHFDAWPELAWEPRPTFPDFAVFFPDPECQPVLRGRSIRVPEGLPPRDAAELVFAQALVGTRARALGLDVVLPRRVAATVAALVLERLRRAPPTGVA